MPFVRAICIIQNHNRIRGELRFEDMQCRVPCHLTERARRPVDKQQINLINIPKGLHVIPRELLALYVELTQLRQPYLGKVTDIVEMKE
jgi:hypothetical protein